MDWWLLFFPTDFVKEKMLSVMNGLLDAGWQRTEYWEYLQWIGCWILLSTTDGYDRRAFFKKASTKEDVRFDGAPFRLNDVMSRRRFEEILSVHCTYSKPYPEYKDDFHPIQELIDAWNDNMT